MWRFYARSRTCRLQWVHTPPLSSSRRPREQSYIPISHNRRGRCFWSVRCMCPWFPLGSEILFDTIGDSALYFPPISYILVHFGVIILTWFVKDDGSFASLFWDPQMRGASFIVEMGKLLHAKKFHYPPPPWGQIQPHQLIYMLSLAVSVLQER